MEYKTLAFGRKKKEEEIDPSPLRWLSKDAQSEFKKVLHPEENVYCVIPGLWEAAIVATDRRIYVFKRE